MLWAAMFNAEYGLVNFLLDYIGFSDYKNHNWLGNVRTANAALIGFSLCYVGYFMVIMLAKTAGISEDYYDAEKRYSCKVVNVGDRKKPY